MSDSEKWAWWTLGVVAMTVVAYGAFVSFFGHGPATSSVFALLALTAFPAFSKRHIQGPTFDEREREIANKALRAGFSALWLGFISLILAIWFFKGSDTRLSLPVWTLMETLLWATLLLLGVQSVATIVLYRSAAHA